VRLQLDMVDTRIEGEACKRHCDGQLLNWLCSAQERLAEQERLLAGRPLPGTLKPVVERKPSSDSRGAAIPRPPDPTTPAMPTEQIAPPIHAVKGIQGVSKGDYPPPCREQSALPDKANPTPPLPAGGPAQQPSLTERPDLE
jgi:hypothetical protein